MNLANRVPALAIPLGIMLAESGCASGDPHRSPEATMQTTSIPAISVEPMQAERVGSGAPIVLVGGGLTGSASWQPHAERLAATRQVIRLQLLSVQYGLEDRPLPADYSVRTESRAMAAALDRLTTNDDAGSLGPGLAVDVVAWSYGALVALDFALDHPERVRTLTLIEPPALWTLPDRGRSLPDAHALEAVLRAIGDDDVSIDALEAFLHTVALVPPGEEPRALPQWDSWVRHRRSLRNGRAPFDHSDDPARLRAFHRPVLLVTGHGTSPFLRAVHDTLAATLPDVRTLELPGGHAPQLAAMDAFLEAVHAFQADEGGEVDEGGANASEPVKHVARSRDGTRIAYWRSGSGPALLLVHGATADHTTTWRLVRGDLERHFTVFAMDRRGRGGSGDAPGYDQRREAEDVAAVIDAIGGPVHVLGHSYGALAALEAARLTANVERIILYEGVPLRGTDLHGPDMADRLAALLEAGDLEGVIVAMYRDLVGMPAAEVDLLRQQRDAWATRVANAPTLPREVAAERAYVFAPERFTHVRGPVLLLVGGDSPPRELAHARAIAHSLHDARVRVMPGQQHAAMYTAPDRFVGEVLRFLRPEPETGETRHT